VLSLVLLLGLGVFLFAMRWDSSDPARVTRRSDVAFWLHLLAAPMIVHPVFALLGLTTGTASLGEALVVIVLYLVLASVALAIDRRALLVSALAYVLFALSQLFRQFGAVELNVALTALVIGSALLLLSAFWNPGERRQAVAAHDDILGRHVDAALLGALISRQRGHPPAIAPAAMHRPSIHSILPPSVNSRTAATLLMTLNSLVSAVARVSPRPRSPTRVVVKNVPVPGPKKPS
jgi:hypothetical protein